MVRLDTIKLEVPIDAIINYDRDQFESDISHSKSDYRRDRLNLGRGHVQLGLNNLVIDKLAEKVIIEISAKILKENYLDLININNMEKVIRNINNSGLIEFKIPYFIDKASLHRFDVANNIRPQLDSKKVISCLLFLPTTPKYFTINYKYGVRIVSRNKSNPEQLTVYDKYEDLRRRNKINTMLRHYIKLEDFKNILKVESNFNKFKKVREMFELDRKPREPILLNDILQSKVNVNYKLLNKMYIYSKNKNCNLTEQQNTYDLETTLGNLFNKDFSLAKLESNIGKRIILLLFNFDMKAIDNLCASRLKGNYSGYKREFSHIRDEMLSSGIVDNSGLCEIVNCLRAEF